MTKSRLPITLFLLLAVLTLLSCNILSTAVSSAANSAINSAANSAVNGATGEKAVAVSQLWSDVPPFPGATKANLDLPPVLNLMLQAFPSAVQSLGGTQGGAQVNSMSYIAFTSSKSPDGVGSFYTLDRMTSAGWNSDQQPGCGTAGSGTPVAAGAFGGTDCLFGKTQGQNITVLAIFAMADKQSGMTELFYVRAEGTASEGTPTS